MSDLELISEANIERLHGEARKLQAALDGAWLPLVLCPTDGVWRLHRLPDGREVVASFQGADLGPMVRRWRVKTFGYHNPARLTGESIGGVEQHTAPYDTFVIQDLPEGVYPTHFRPNDTVFGDPAPPTQPQADEPS